MRRVSHMLSSNRGWVQIIPRAIDYFTGKALEFEDLSDDDSDVFGSDFEDDDDDDDNNDLLGGRQRFELREGQVTFDQVRLNFLTFWSCVQISRV